MTRALERQEHLRSALRVAVALSALAIYYFGDPSEHPARRPFGIAVLLLFLAYALAMYVLAIRRNRYVPTSAAPWIDLGWVTILVAVSQATSAIFFPLYLFPILYASFGNGFRAGIAVALAAVAAFSIVGTVTAPRGPVFDVNAFLTRPLYLLLLGYFTAVWGEHEVRSRARLALLRDVTSLSNPRFGVERTIGRFLEAVRKSFRASSCRLVVEQRGGERWMQTAARDAADPAEKVALPAEVAKVLLPEVHGATLHVHARRRWLRTPAIEVNFLERDGAAPTEHERALAADLARTLEAAALLSVPFRYHATANGRLHIARAGARPFDPSDVDFVRHLLDQVVPVLENIRLVDRLASDAAEEERRRIARDLHDSVIQPYLGLRLGLSAAQQALAAGRNDEGAAHVARLVELASDEIQTLRRYVRELRAGEAGSGGGFLDEGVRRFCSRFAAATGIRVDVSTEGNAPRSDRLAAEVFQMIVEALSNVRRHTSAGAAGVRIRATDARLCVTVTNDAASPGEPAFLPRSLAERAAALGGSVRVEHPDAGTTAVHVEIPL